MSYVEVFHTSLNSYKIIGHFVCNEGFILKKLNELTLIQTSL